MSEVPAILQLMDRCQSYQALQRLGRRIHRTKGITDMERAVLRDFYDECRIAMIRLGLDMRPAASEKQLKALARMGCPEWELADLTKDQGRTLMGKYRGQIERRAAQVLAEGTAVDKEAEK